MVVAGFILRRSAAAIVVLVGLSILIFVVARIIPGDPARMALGSVATPEQVEKLRHRLHLDESLPVQYWETAYAHGSGRESLPPDVEVEVRAGERVECSLYVPADGATT